MTIEQWLNNYQLGIDIWKKKYQKNDETLDEWFDRIANGNEEVKKIIQEKKFLFGGRILSNRNLHGSEKVTYSNCYVIAPPEDSLESIYDSRKKLARTYSYGGGCGIDISKIAPNGAKVRNQAKQSTGAVSFMQGYSDITAEICQLGRRGALMISIDCTHPDLLDFINIKTKENSVTKANISIKVTNKFMEAVIDDGDWELFFKREETGEIISKVLKAKEIFKIICENNWNWAEPGVIYWDTVCNYNLLSNNENFEYAGLNPCAEEPLPAGGSCLLGSLNLSEFVKYPFTDKAEFDFKDFSNTVNIAVKALNEVLDEGLELHPLAEQRESVRKWRQIGLGIMGLADCFIKMGLSYGSVDSIILLNQIGSVLVESGIKTSAQLADELGPYEEYNDKVLSSNFFSKHFGNNQDMIDYVKEKGLRNSQLFTCAPTGSIATMLNISSGIEPIFAKSWTRKTESLHNEEVIYKEYPKIIQQLMEFQYIEDENELPDFVITSHEIKPINRIEIQSALQQYIDASISSTINLPEETTIEEIEEIYLEAWRQGLKGTTIYREGCARTGILQTKESKENKIPQRGEVIPVQDNNIIGLKRKLTTGCGSLHCTAFFDGDTKQLVETYLSKGSTGGCNNFMVGLSRMISMSARAGVSLDDIIDQLMSTGSCPSYAARSATKKDTSKGSCCPMAVGYALKDMYKEFFQNFKNENISFTIETEDNKGEKCPECGAKIYFEGGCNICKECGWTKCE